MSCKVVCIIQARMGSSRLPGKSLSLLAGKPLLWHVIYRTMQAKLIDRTVLATTNLSDDDVLSDLAISMGASVFRGSTDDLVARYYNAALEYDASVIVRIPADNPLVHPTEIDRIINYFQDNSGLDFATNLGPFLENGYPDGLGAEVFSMKTLTYLYHHVVNTYHREHVTSIFRENPNQYNVGTISCPKEFSRTDIVLDINTEQEYHYMESLFNDLYREGQLMNIKDIISWVDNTSLERIS